MSREFSKLSSITDPQTVQGLDLSNRLNSEVIKGTTYFNFSGKPLQEILRWFPPSLKAERVTLLPDLCPGRSPLPTGCCVEIDERTQPYWRKFAVSDVGCGMQVLRTSFMWDDFESNLSLWDEVAVQLKANKGQLGDLGSGNHFLDAAVDLDDQNERVYFVIHTGSRDESAKATDLVDKPHQFDAAYTKHYSLGKK